VNMKTNSKYMKQSTNIIPALVIASSLVAGLAGSNALAGEFSGSIAFGATGVTTDNSILADASTFSLTDAYVTSATGEYATLGATAFTPATFNGFTFNPPVASVDPLWTFDIGSTVFSFDATSLTSTWLPGVDNGEWVILGSGIASMTGFEDTPGEWTLNLSDSGNLSVGFDATAATTAPDGGTTVTLLGFALTAMGLYLRKFPC
jgi:hypothetical protein